MSDIAALEAQLHSLQGQERIDVLNQAARLVAEHDPVRARRLGTEAHELALQLQDDLRAALSLLGLGLLDTSSDSAQAHLLGAIAALSAAVRERSDLHRQLQEQALTLARSARQDALTGLLNRRYFLETFAWEHARTRRFNYPLSVALFDIDQLARINRRYSQAVGDEVVRQVGQILSRHCGEMDILARYAGEEFALLLHGFSPEGASELCARLCAAVAEFGWENLRPELRVSVSVGVSDDEVLGGPERMLASAEENLRSAKRLVLARTSA